MSTRNAVQQAFDTFGKGAGFLKKSGSWYRVGTEVISVTNLQKSQYGPSYFLNQGFWLRQLGGDLYPKSHQAHIVARAETLIPGYEVRLGELLDLGIDCADDVRIRELAGLLEAHLLPLIELGDSVAGIRRLAEEGIFARAGVTRVARHALGLPEPT